jgi:hypothetical protein
MRKSLITISPFVLSVIIASFALILSSCEESPGEWEREKIRTDYGDYFEHYYRFVPGGFNDPLYEHRILYNGKELLSYTKEHEDSGIECIYTDEKLIVYDIHMELFYRKSGERDFQLFPLDSSKKDFYHVYYKLLFTMNVDVVNMLLSSGDKYTQNVVLAYAQGDFSEAEKQGVSIEKGEEEALTDYCSYLVEEYSLTKASDK